jgi:hypothetical protein
LRIVIIIALREGGNVVDAAITGALTAAAAD